MDLEEAVTYYNSLNGKGIRKYIAAALAQMYNVPEIEIAAINKWTSDLHNASLVIDDIQDAAPFRRGQPSAHIKYGIPIAMSSAYVTIFRSVYEIQTFTRVSPLIIDLLYRAHEGQGFDIHCSTYKVIPSFQEYETLVQLKTGNLLLILLELIRAASKNGEATCNYETIKGALNCFALFFQIRDDYVNLTSPEYWAEKGFCLDLEEGKMSYLCLLARARNISMDMSPDGMESKNRILRDMYAANVFDEALKKLDDLKSSVLKRLPLDDIFDKIPYYPFSLSSIDHI